MTPPNQTNVPSKLNLNELGLKESDLPAIESLSKEFSKVNNLSVAEYGKDISSKTNECTQELLALVQNRDLDETGTKLNQVLTVAQGINGSNLIANQNKLSRLPLIGGLFKSAKKARNNFAMKFNNTNNDYIRAFDYFCTIYDKKIVCKENDFLDVNEKNYFCNGKYIGTATKYDGNKNEIDNFKFNGIIPKDKFFVVGTHPLSHDSKYFGFVDKSQILRKAIPLF